ncbi:hypothetical protein [Nocardia sp. NPDC049149]|uniref:hypothetical protein n=1 Tax=Nocardia sp. NPDC049149 TaxID=3364315 RepID=UPI0037125B53
MRQTEAQERDAVAATQAALLDQLDRYLPDPDYRAYFRWALSEQNPQRALFTRIIALTQLGNLTAAMLADLPGPDDWPTLVRHAIPVNVYQVFEVVSDNLGIGLALVAPDEPSETRDLLLHFNAVAAADLRTPTKRPAVELLAPLRARSERISAFTQSLRPDEHARIVDAYADSTGHASARLERSVWSGLVANLESGRDVLSAIAGTSAEPQVRAQTIERYRAVDRTLRESRLGRDDLVDICRNAILVTPTLGYFAAVFGELSHLDSGYLAAVADGSLFAAFDTAAVLVRLLNDIGTPLLQMSRDQRHVLLSELLLRYPADTVITVLAKAIEEPALNRFRKDLAHGEFNVCLHPLLRVDDLDEGLTELTDGLDHFAELYARRSTLLDQQLAELGQRLHDGRILEVTRRFVDFHRRLYTHRYDTLAGDYAI